MSLYGPTETAKFYAVEFARETDGRWIAEIPELPGVMAYGRTQLEAMGKVGAIAQSVTRDR